MNDSFFASENFKQFFKNSQRSLIIKADAPRYTIIAVSDKFVEMAHVERENLLGKGIFEAFPASLTNPECANTIYKTFEQVITEKKPVTPPVFRYDIFVPEAGTTQPLYWSTTHEPLFSDQEEVDYIINTTINVTEQVELQKREEAARLALATQQKRMNDLFMQAPLGMVFLSKENAVVEYANQLINKILNIDDNEPIVGQSMFSLLPKQKHKGFQKIYQQVLTEERPYTASEASITYNRNGESVTRYFDIHFAPVPDADEQISGIMALANDVTLQVEARKKVAASENRFKKLTDAMPQQVWTALPDGRINYVNQGVLDYNGNHAPLPTGSQWQSYIHPDDLAATMRAWNHSLQTGETYLIEFRLRNLDGVYKWHLGRAVPLIEDGQITLWVGTNTDIDHQKSNEQKKDEFLSIASHELKTPLTSIKAYNQLMQRSYDVDKLAAFVQKSAGHIQRLEQLIDDLLDVTKINAGKIAYNFQEFNFEELIKEAVESVQHTASKHKIIIENSCAVTYRGDRLRLEQVLNNFLTNAVKYSPEANQVLVNCTLHEESIVVSVQDFGIGIAPESLDRLFERYYRVDNTAMRFEGLGLGLFIASEILKRHNGSFWIESELGKGSTFYFRLPLTTQHNSLPVYEPGTYYEDSTIRISANQTENILEVDWLGYQNFDSVKSGCLRMLELAIDNRCNKILNDNTHVLGTWADAAEWVGQEYFPMMDKAGIRYVAWIYSPSTFSQLAAKKSVEMAVGAVTTQLFDNRQLAMTWISQK